MNILLCIVFDKSLTNLWQIFDKCSYEELLRIKQT